MTKHTLKTLLCSHHNPHVSFKKKPCCWHVLQTSDRSYKVQFCFCRKEFVETKMNIANQFFKGQQVLRDICHKPVQTGKEIYERDLY